VARREHVSAAELAAGLGLGALEALRIAARSGANRGALLQADALPALVGLLKARPRGGAACCSLPVLLLAMPRPAACRPAGDGARGAPARRCHMLQPTCRSR